MLEIFVMMIMMMIITMAYPPSYYTWTLDTIKIISKTIIISKNNNYSKNNEDSNSEEDSKNYRE